MKRRDFLRLLLSTPIAMQYDVEKLLWVKEKTIFLPPKSPILTYDNIVLAELDRVLPRITDLFYKDSIFYGIRDGLVKIKGNPIRIPLKAGDK